MHALEQTLQHELSTLKAHAPLRRVMVAFSGGLDSTALLLACRQVLQPAGGMRIAALHVHHGLQPEADHWLDHCRATAAQLQVDFVAAQVQVAAEGNLEANARRARYRAFRQQLQSTDCLVLGHHRQDQVETVLMRLFSGRGLLPMRHSGRLGDGRFLRPLLDLPRSLLEDYVTRAGVRWVEDPSNRQEHLQRNFLRRQIVPRLQQHWPGLSGAVLRVAGHAAATEDALAHALRHQPDRVAVSELPAAADAQRVWLRAYLAQRGCRRSSDAALDEFLRQLQGGSALLELPGTAGHQLHGYAAHLYFEPPPGPAPAYPHSLALGESLQCAYGALSLEPAAPQAPLASVYEGPLCVDVRRPGLRLQRQDGKSTSVKQLLQQAAMPPWRRSAYPLLFSNGRLLCVPEIALAAGAAADAPGKPWCRARWLNRADSTNGG